MMFTYMDEKLRAPAARSTNVVSTREGADRRQLEIAKRDYNELVGAFRFDRIVGFLQAAAIADTVAMVERRLKTRNGVPILSGGVPRTHELTSAGQTIFDELQRNNDDYYANDDHRNDHIDRRVKELYEVLSETALRVAAYYGIDAGHELRRDTLLADVASPVTRDYFQERKSHHSDNSHSQKNLGSVTPADQTAYEATLHDLRTDPSFVRLLELTLAQVMKPIGGHYRGPADHGLSSWDGMADVARLLAIIERGTREKYALQRDPPFRGNLIFPDKESRAALVIDSLSEVAVRMAAYYALSNGKDFRAEAAHQAEARRLSFN